MPTPNIMVVKNAHSKNVFFWGGGVYSWEIKLWGMG